MSENLELDVFWSVRSPWSYLATPRLVEWQQRYALDVNLRVVYPLAIRTPEFFDRVHPLWVPYFMLDVQRVAEFLKLPIAPPRPDPVVQTMVDGRLSTAPEQPYIYRATRLCVAAAERGRGIEFADELSRIIWGGTENWHEGDVLAEGAARAGLDLAELDATIEAETPRIEAVIDASHEAHAAAGHWGVPTCVFRGEPFFGQDRLDVLMWRLEGAGLRERA